MMHVGNVLVLMGQAGMNVRMRMRFYHEAVVLVLMVLLVNVQMLMQDGLVRVEWYRNFRELARGLRKNSFAGLEYSIVRFIGAIAVTLLVNVWPFVAAFTTTGATRVVYAAVAITLIALYAFSATAQRNRPWLAPLFPVAALLFLYVLVDAVVRTLVSGGIEWRGTRYALDDLRANKL